jgi:hypothetical protein
MRRQLAIHGLPEAAHSLPTVIDAKSEVLLNKSISRLVLHATEQMAVHDLEILLTQLKQQLTHVLVMVDMHGMPGAPAYGVGWLAQELLLCNKFNMQETKASDVDRTTFSASLKVNVDAARHRKFDMMRLERTLDNDKPGTYLISTSEFATLLKHAGAPESQRNPFAWQILCETQEDRKEILGHLYDRKDKPFRDGVDYYRGQMLLLRDSTAVWGVTRTFESIAGREMTIDRAAQDRDNSCMTLQLEDLEVKQNAVCGDRQQFRTIDCEFIGSCLRKGVPRVFYKITKRTKARNVYEALKMATKQCIFVGSDADLQAAVGRPDSFMDQFRVCNADGKQSFGEDSGVVDLCSADAAFSMELTDSPPEEDELGADDEEGPKKKKQRRKGPAPAPAAAAAEEPKAMALLESIDDL